MTFRDTFGIIGYDDIITASLDKLTITVEDYDRRYIHYKNKDYILHCDPNVRRMLGYMGDATCLVSFQERKTGFYAMARLYREKL